jgi:hypothetical protein
MFQAMTLPRPVEPLLKAVWEECDPQLVTSGRYYQPSFGLPPKELRIYQAPDADWDNALIRPPYTSGWQYVGGADVEAIAPDDLPDFSVETKGMYWPVGVIDFCLDLEHKRAVFGYQLGPRYGRGFRIMFEDPETLEFVPEKSRLVWRS